MLTPVCQTGTPAAKVERKLCARARIYLWFRDLQMRLATGLLEL
jgi:hypothetical protein